MVTETDLVKAGVTAYIAKDMVKALLGPTMEYLGQETKGLVEKCNINISNIFKKAYAKIIDIDDPQLVNVRAFREIINEGKMIEDELFAEYFGGLLASSRSPDGKDDRAVYYINMIKSLSIYQIKIHFLTYSKLFEEIKENFLDIRSLKERKKIKIYIPEHVIHEYFRCHASQVFLFATHALTGLSEKSLIFRESSFGSAYNEHKFETSGIITGPTVLGIELYFLANGLKNIGINELTSHNVESLGLKMSPYALKNTAAGVDFFKQDLLKMKLVR